MNLSKIGQFISRRRMAMGLTQAQLAERLNVTDKAVSKWERGKSLPGTGGKPHTVSGKQNKVQFLKMKKSNHSYFSDGHL